MDPPPFPSHVSEFNAVSLIGSKHIQANILQTPKQITIKHLNIRARSSPVSPPSSLLASIYLYEPVPSPPTSASLSLSLTLRMTLARQSRSTISLACVSAGDFWCIWSLQRYTHESHGRPRTYVRLFSTPTTRFDSPPFSSPYRTTPTPRAHIVLLSSLCSYNASDRFHYTCR